jgi:hypothetical protein
MSSDTPQELERSVIALGSIYFSLILTAIAYLAG